MKKSIYVLILLVFSLIVFSACNENPDDEVDIMYKSVDKQHVFIMDTLDLALDDSPESLHIDSIISGLIDAELVSTGYLRYDLDQNTNPDIAFEIIDLKPYNDDFPESFDSLAIRAHSYTVEFLDNSTYQYADALDANEQIGSDGNWTTQTIVLGTFQNAGNFNGQGDKFLAFRIVDGSIYKYGWIKVNCSEHNDTLKVIDYAFNKIHASSILAGQMN